MTKDDLTNPTKLYKMTTEQLVNAVECNEFSDPVVAVLAHRLKMTLWDLKEVEGNLRNMESENYYLNCKVSDLENT